MQITQINHKLVISIIRITKYNYIYVTVRLLSSSNHRHGKSLVFAQ